MQFEFGWKNQWTKVALAFVCATAFVHTAELGYVWKSNEVLRFEYIKNIAIEEEANADEICNDHPATLLQASVDVVNFKQESEDAIAPLYKLGRVVQVATCKQGEKLTLTGSIKEDEHHAKWVGVLTAAGIDGYIAGTTKMRDTREFKFNAILVVEVKNRTPNGTFAVMHFDSAHIEIPESYAFTAIIDDPALQKDRAKTILHAMEGAIKLARWNVVMDPTGVVHMDSRSIKALDEWLKETEHAAFWRAKFRKLWVEIVEKRLALAPIGDDRDMLLALSGEPIVTTGELAKIRPYRATAERVAIRSGKSDYQFTRVLPPKAGQPFAVPYIGPPDDPKMPSIFMTLKAPIKGPITESDPQSSGPQIGSAVFDTKLGMLDSLNEGYSFDTEYACDEDARRKYHLLQKVSVTYSLKRLAPPILGTIEQAIEAPLKGK